MLMRKMELKNFRQYVGEQVVEFSEDPEKNVTLILGKNTSGKTTIIQAFRWVLYNDSNFTGKRDEPKSVLNSDVRKTMRPGDVQEAKVTLTFIHKGITYELSRRYEYYSKVPGEGYFGNDFAALYYYPNGEREMMKGGLRNLDEILPESLAEYFFFDGEKIAQSRKPEMVKNSINTIMGLVPLEHLITHLSKGRYNVYSDLRNSMKSDSGVDMINRKIDRATADLEIAKSNKNEAHTRYEDSSSRAENLRVEMEKIKDIAKAAGDLKEVDLKIDLAKERISRAEIGIVNAFASAMAESMINCVSLDILKNLAENKYEDKGIPGMNATAIHFVLDSGKCICGADLTSSEKCRERLHELLTYLPPESIGTQISHLNNKLKDTSTASGKQDAYNALNVNYSQQLENLEYLEERHEELSDTVKNYRDADEIMKNYETARKMKEQFHSDEVRYEGVIQELNKTISALNAELSVAGRADSFNKEIMDKMSYVQALYNKACKQYEDNSGGIFEEIQKTLTTVFNSMYHGSRTIELTPEYKVRLTVGGENLDNSKGLDTVQNFAFIASLLKVAKDRAGLELSSEAYPLAMDAVFSNTDEGHIQNICRELPKLAEQAVLAIMDKDWSIAASSLEEHVGKKYRIKKLSETHSEIVEYGEETL